MLMTRSLQERPGNNTVRRQGTKDAEAQGKTYADTLATLLALLSHPSKLDGQDTLDMAAKTVIFIIDSSTN